ncbi:MAG: hypothetical protein AAGG45_01220 [Pseudomonadota bacterium]
MKIQDIPNHVGFAAVYTTHILKKFQLSKSNTIFCCHPQHHFVCSMPGLPFELLNTLEIGNEIFPFGIISGDRKLFVGYEAELEYTILCSSELSVDTCPFPSDNEITELNAYFVSEFPKSYGLSDVYSDIIKLIGV